MLVGTNGFGNDRQDATETNHLGSVIYFIRTHLLYTDTATLTDPQ